MSKNKAQAQDQIINLTNEVKGNDALLAEIARLKAENHKLTAEKSKVVTSKLSIKVSSKGAVSVYGLGRWPVTLYASQWTRLLSVAKDIAQFITDNKSKLSEKAES